MAGFALKEISMKAPKEYKKIINRLRKANAKNGAKNGSLKNYALDHPYYERLLYNSKHNAQKHRFAF